MDIVQAVKDGKAKFQWAEVKSEHAGNTLYISVFRDAMKFDGYQTTSGRVVDGVRLPATAVQMQEIADATSCMLLTPKVNDLIWLQAKIKFNPVYNINGHIVATSPIESVHDEIEKKIQNAGGDDGVSLIDSVGKYWVITNGLARPQTLKYGVHSCCNYGWCSSDGIYQGVTPGVKVWQGCGYEHNDEHVDPSQTIRLMYMFARLIRAGQSDWEQVALIDVMKDPALAPLVNHDGVLAAFRQPSVPEPQPTVGADGTVTLPTLNVYAMPSWQT